MINVCKECGEYEITQDDFCPVCHWKLLCEYQKKKIFDACKIFENIIKTKKGKKVNIQKLHEILNEANMLFDLQPPKAALLIESGIEENIAEVTHWIKQKRLIDVRKMLRKIGNLFNIQEYEYYRNEILRKLLFLSHNTFPGEQNAVVMVSLLSHPQLTDYLIKLGFEETKEINLDSIELEITGGYFSYMRGDDMAGGSRASVFNKKHYSFTNAKIFRYKDIFFVNNNASAPSEPFDDLLDDFEGKLERDLEKENPEDLELDPDKIFGKLSEMLSALENESNNIKSRDYERDIAHFIGPQDRLLFFLLDFIRDYEDTKERNTNNVQNALSRPRDNSAADEPNQLNAFLKLLTTETVNLGSFVGDIEIALSWWTDRESVNDLTKKNKVVRR